jgi:hypothetical protein
MAQALAAAQCPANHFIPAFISGNPTIINAWLGHGNRNRVLLIPKNKPNRVNGQSRPRNALRNRKTLRSSSSNEPKVTNERKDVKRG